MNCLKCNAKVEANWAHCPSCGEKLPEKLVCAKCGKELQPEWKSCPFCGQAGSGQSMSATDVVAKEFHQTQVKGDEVVMGDKVVHEAADPSAKQQATMTGVHCPICHLVVVGADHFRCPKCERKYIHSEHQDERTRLCSECAEELRRSSGDVRDGDVLGDRYEIRKLLGQGGMGKVFLGYDRELSREFALKFLPPEMAQNPSAMADLRREADVLLELSHENLVRLYDLGTVDSHRFLKLEYVDGPSLEHLLADKNAVGERLDVDEVIEYAEQISTGLTYLHGRKVVHRDLKPGNLMVNSRGVIKIMDFGIAQLMRDTMSRVSNRPTTGTLVYMSPEQLLGKGLDHRSDIYALGCVLYEMLSGRPPFYTGPIYEQHLHAEPQPIEGVPAHVNAAIQSALAKDADERPQSSDELMHALTTAPPPTARVHFESTPPGAAVLLDGTERGKAPLELTLEAGEYDVTFEMEGYKSKAGALRFDGERDRRLTMTLEPDARIVLPSGLSVPSKSKDGYGNPVRQGTDPDCGLPLEACIDQVDIPVVLCPAGEFTMGEDSGEHRVVLTQPFYIGKYQVTQREWASTMDSKPWSGEDYAKDDERHAASYISWDDTQEFLQRFASSTGLKCRLPTEAEWEYACRAGSTSKWCFGDDESQLKDYAWYDENAYDVGEKYAHGVGLKKANAWGLYDMHGNVFEWCEDWYDGDYYSKSPTEDPPGPSSGESRVLRGGSWDDDASDARCAGRDYFVPALRYNYYGFRVCVCCVSPE